MNYQNTENDDFGSYIAMALKNLKSLSKRQKLKEEIILVIHNFFIIDDLLVVKNEDAPDLGHSSKTNFNSSSANEKIDDEVLRNKSIYSKCIMHIKFK